MFIGFVKPGTKFPVSRPLWNMVFEIPVLIILTPSNNYCPTALCTRTVCLSDFLSLIVFEKLTVFAEPQ